MIAIHEMLRTISQPHIHKTNFAQGSSVRGLEAFLLFFSAAVSHRKEHAVTDANRANEQLQELSWNLWLCCFLFWLMGLQAPFWWQKVKRVSKTCMYKQRAYTKIFTLFAGIARKHHGSNKQRWRRHACIPQKYACAYVRVCALHWGGILFKGKGTQSW